MNGEFWKDKNETRPTTAGRGIRKSNLGKGDSNRRQWSKKTVPDGGAPIAGTPTQGGQNRWSKKTVGKWNLLEWNPRMSGCYVPSASLA